jgi:hypothetical protein
VSARNNAQVDERIDTLTELSGRVDKLFRDFCDQTTQARSACLVSALLVANTCILSSIVFRRANRSLRTEAKAPEEADASPAAGKVRGGVQSTSKGCYGDVMVVLRWCYHDGALNSHH